MHAMHELRAEYVAQPASPDAQRGRRARRHSGLGQVKVWHMVRGVDGFFGTTAMCGRELHPRAAALPEQAWGTTREPMCHTCGALYLREVP